MASAKRRYGKEEFARRGDEIFESQVRPRLKPEDDGKFAAIDVESGAYELDPDELEACDKLNARIPDAQTFCGLAAQRQCAVQGKRSKKRLRKGAHAPSHNGSRLGAVKGWASASPLRSSDSFGF